MVNYSRMLWATELKLVFVPICFLLIRVWGLILDIRTFYLSRSSEQNFEKTKADQAFLFLAVRPLVLASNHHKSHLYIIIHCPNRKVPLFRGLFCSHSRLFTFVVSLYFSLHVCYSFE